MTCVNCGVFNSDHSHYCYSCGVFLTPRAPGNEPTLHFGFVLLLAILAAFLGSWLVNQIDTNYGTKIAQASYIPEVGPYLISTLLGENLDELRWAANQDSEAHYSTQPVRVWVRGVIPETQEVLAFSFDSRPRNRTLEIVGLNWDGRQVPLWEIRAILGQMVRKEWNLGD